MVACRPTSAAAVGGPAHILAVPNERVGFVFSEAKACYRHIKTILEGRPHNLLESVAAQLVTDLFQQFHMVQGIRLKICKPHVAVAGVLDSLGGPSIWAWLQLAAYSVPK